MKKEDPIAEVAPQRFAKTTAAPGFGCGSLSTAGRKNAERVLAAAFDSGTRHFDVARYYGYGESEGILGRFLKGRRSQVTITTKFGIDPPKRTVALAFALGIGRQVMRLMPSVRGTLQRRAVSFVTSGVFGVEQAQRSLETSLRELGTDHIDFFLLHDYAIRNQTPHELLAFLDQSIQSGKIGSFGIGTGIDNVVQVIEQQPQLAPVVQFQNSVLTRNLERLPQSDSSRVVITHGALSANYRSILRFLEARRDLANDWALKLGCRRLDHDTLPSLMLQYAAMRNPKGYVVFSSREPARVAHNARAILEPRFSDTQIALFEAFVQQESANIE